jgi:hypothetical protein
MQFCPQTGLVREHHAWLRGFDRSHTGDWDYLLADNPEAALCEAAVRRILEQNGNVVEPAARLHGSRRSPDFRCGQARKTFFVEVTCISIERATERTGLAHRPHHFDFAGVGRLSDAIFHECRRKTPQCSGLPGPAILAVGTFHWYASYLCFERAEVELLLTGEPLLAQDVEATTGAPVGASYLATKLRSAAFLRPHGGWMSHARHPVAAILACGLGQDPPTVRCALHPKPVRPFDRALLPGVECCRLLPGYESGRLRTQWF